MRRIFGSGGLDTSAHEFNLRNPFTAAALSVVPGLGHLYNGQTTKGLLFIDVSFVNFGIIGLMLLAEPISRALKELATEFHSKPNQEVLHTLYQLHIGTTVSNMILALILGFVIFAARDAYDSAKVKKLKALYADSVIGITEAASGSYIFHLASMATIAFLALFFFLPAPPRTQITEIEFLPTTQPKEPVKPPATVRVRSDHDTNPTRHNDPTRPTQQQQRSASAPRAVQRQAEAPRTVTPPRQTEAPRVVQQRTTEAPKPVTQPAPARPMPIARPLLAMVPQPAVPAPQPIKATTPTNVAPVPRAVAVPTPIGAPAPLRALQPGTNPVMPAPMPTAALGHSSVPGPMPSAVSGSKSGQNTSAPAPVAIGAGSPSSRQGAGPMPAATGPSISRGTESGQGIPAPTKGHGPNGLGRPGTFDVKPNVDGPGSGLRSESGNSKTASPKDGDGGTIKDVDFGPYMAELQRRIKHRWIPPKTPLSNRTRVIFHVSLTGELSGLRLERSSGNAAVDQAAMQAVRDAAPFPNLPKGAEHQTTDGTVAIEFTFDYNVFGGGQGKVMY